VSTRIAQVHRTEIELLWHWRPGRRALAARALLSTVVGVIAFHGQSLGATFEQRYGTTLQAVVESLMGGQASVAAATAQIAGRSSTAPDMDGA
jgi:hypothetical protein